MEKIFSHSAKFLFGYMFYEIYEYNKISKYEDMMKTAINVDLSFEKIEPQILNKDILIATSVNNILFSGKRKEYFYLKSNLESFDERNSILEFKLDEDDSNKLKIELNHSNFYNNKELQIEENKEKMIDYLSIEFTPNSKYIYFDPPVLKTVPVKDCDKFNSDNFDKLKFLEKLNCYVGLRNSKKILNVSKGFTVDQKLLIFGKIIKNELISNKSYSIKPRFLIGSGLVELEEILEYSKVKSNTKLFNLLAILAMISLTHFTYRILFHENDKKKKKNF